MGVKLKVLTGKLKNRRGESAGWEVHIQRPRFVIGTAKDCHMCCASSSISSRHCEIILRDGRVLLRDLNSESGTFVNDERVIDEHALREGDRLRIGRLEFEVAISSPKATAKLDPVGDFVSQLLVDADEEERSSRLSDPQLRQFQRDVKSSRPPDAAAPEVEDKMEALRRKLPGKKPPGKLPPPPSLTSETSTGAAEETLKKILKPAKRRSRPPG